VVLKTAAGCGSIADVCKEEKEETGSRCSLPGAGRDQLRLAGGDQDGA
jgi:hypothetical protein